MLDESIPPERNVAIGTSALVLILTALSIRLSNSSLSKFECSIKLLGTQYLFNFGFNLSLLNSIQSIVLVLFFIPLYRVNGEESH